MRAVSSNTGTYVGEHLLDKPSPLSLIECSIEAEYATRALQAISRHLQLVHGVDILDMQLHARPVRRFGRPHVQVFMASRFEVQGVVTVVQVRKFRQQGKLISGVKL